MSSVPVYHFRATTAYLLASHPVARNITLLVAAQCRVVLCTALVLLGPNVKQFVGQEHGAESDEILNKLGLSCAKLNTA